MAMKPCRKPPEQRKQGRNHRWRHLFNEDIISMPDKWEYPWYAAWDLSFHSVAIARADPDFSKAQLSLFLREWYMHPNGQLPAYEWAFDDVNPPVHAWASWRVFKIDQKIKGKPDFRFPRACLSQTPDELHMVGEPQGLGRRKRFRRWVPGPRQHRHLRSKCAASVWMASRAIGWLELDGDVLPEHAQNRAATRELSIPLTKTLPVSFLSIFSTSLMRSIITGDPVCGMKKTASTTIACVLSDGKPHFASRSVSVGLVPLFAYRYSRNTARSTAIQASKNACNGSSIIAKI